MESSRSRDEAEAQPSMALALVVDDQRAAAR
jgi:hypothetical protein